MATTAASRALGLGRDRLLATFFGAGSELGVFWAAVEIPDTIFYILGSAIFSAAFIPVFTQYLKRGEDGDRRHDAALEEAWAMAGSVLKLSLLFFLVLAGLILIFTQPVCRLVAPGFTSSEIGLMSGLVRVMLLAQFFFVLGYFFTGVLNSFQRFLVPALAAVLYNLGVVLGVLLLSDRYGVWGPAWGMVAGAVLHTLIQWLLARSLGFSVHDLRGKLVHPGTKRVLRITGPRLAALLGNKISLLFQVGLASLAPVFGQVSNVVVLAFARHLEALPIGLFGLSISQAAFPTLSMNSGDLKRDEFKKTLITSLHQTLFLIAPAAIILLVLRIPLVRLAFGARRFTWKATILTGYTVAFFSLGVIGEAILNLFYRAFYAMEEAKTPVTVSVIFSVFEILLAVAFTRLWGWGVWSIPLALVIGGIGQCFVLFILLERELGGFARADFFLPIAKIGWATLFSGIALYVPLKLLDKLVFDTTRTLNLLILTGIAGAFGLIVYLFFTWILRVRETKVFLGIILSRLGIKKVATE